MASTHTPRRIVCLQPSATVILAAVGELDRVVACTKYCVDVVPEVARSSRAILADSWTAEHGRDRGRAPGTRDRCRSLPGEGGQRDSEIGRTISGTGSQDSGRHLHRHCHHRGRGWREPARRGSHRRHAGPHRGGSRTDQPFASAARILRGVGQAADRVATLGRRVGGSCGW